MADIWTEGSVRRPCPLSGGSGTRGPSTRCWFCWGRTRSPDGEGIFLAWKARLCVPKAKPRRFRRRMVDGICFPANGATPLGLPSVVFRVCSHRLGSGHGCPRTNRAFWDRKRETNMARDCHVTRQVRRQGWKVIRIWQHSLQKSPATCLNRIHRALESPT